MKKGRVLSTHDLSGQQSTECQLYLGQLQVLEQHVLLAEDVTDFQQKILMSHKTLNHSTCLVLNFCDEGVF